MTGDNYLKDCDDRPLWTPKLHENEVSNAKMNHGALYCDMFELSRHILSSIFFVCMGTLIQTAVCLPSKRDIFTKCNEIIRAVFLQETFDIPYKLKVKVIDN